MKILSMILAFLFALGIAFADPNEKKTAGTITAVDASKKLITVTTPDNVSMVFAVAPSTELDYKKQKGKPVFTDLKVGTWVKIEYFPGDAIHTAEEIDIYPAAQ